MLGLYRKLRYGNKFGVPKSVVEKLMTPNLVTPDMAELQARKFNLVFLYGNEMKGCREAIKDVQPLYGADVGVHTTDPYVMIKVRENAKVTPVVLEPPNYHLVAGTVKRMPKATIRGELFQLTANEIAELDKLRGNGKIYTRVRVKITVPHHTLTNHAIGRERVTMMSEQLRFDKRVHMYLGNYEFFSFAKIDAKSAKLLKTRDDNSNYVSRYFYGPEDRV
jgi:gamma-glutamylcyclotransferase (GGCT)/AIG2-like uncharacterized protein YtfP